LLYPIVKIPSPKKVSYPADLFYFIGNYVL